MDLNDLAAILVLYECVPLESKTLISLNESCKKAGNELSVFIYDNSTLKQPIPEFSHLKIEEIYHNPSNPGVSAGYNHFAYNLQQVTDWFLLLDQDTEFPGNYISELLQLEDKEVQLIVPQLRQGSQLISPHIFRHGYSYSDETLKPGWQTLRSVSFLNSGILISKDQFLDADGYPQDVPLYFSDQVFVHRLKKTGLTHFYLLRSTCTHAMASNDESDPEAFINRYEMFLTGARKAAKHYPLTLKAGLKTLVLLRGAKLALRHKKFDFLKKAIASL